MSTDARAQDQFEQRSMSRVPHLAERKCCRRARSRGFEQTGVPVGAPYRQVETASARRSIGSAQSGHAPGVSERPPLAGPFHSGLEEVPVGAFDCAAADRQAVLLVEPVLHPVRVGSVVADEVPQGLERLALPTPTLHQRHAAHDLGDDCIRAARCEKLFSPPLPDWHPRALLSEQDLRAVYAVLDRVVPVEDLHCIGTELVGERPVARGAMADPNSDSCA
jgi:hypothetical protein